MYQNNFLYKIEILGLENTFFTGLQEEKRGIQNVSVSTSVYIFTFALRIYSRFLASK